MATPQQSLTQDILTAYTHLLPDAVVGHYSEKHLDINNPYSSDLRWELSYSASPFVRKTAGEDRMRSSRRAAGEGRGGGGGEILKANYSVFWVSERKGTTPPQSTSKVAQSKDVLSFLMMCTQTYRERYDTNIITLAMC